MEQELGLQCLLQMIGQLARWIAENIFDAKLELNFLQTSFSGVDGPFRFIHLKVDVAFQRRHNSRKTLIRIGSLRACARNDKRSTRFVDKDGVDLVDNGERMTTLHTS